MAHFDLFNSQSAPKGVATLVKTPFLENGRLDEASFVRQVEHVVDVGTCLAITGMHGSETYAVDDSERVRCLEMTLEVCAGRVPVCAAVVGLSIPEAVAAAQRAERMGADLIALISPPWILSAADLLLCVKAVADAVSLPNLVHSLGSGGKIVLPVEDLARLPAESPNILYLKEEAEHAPRRVSALLGLPGGDAYHRIMGGPPIVLGYRAGARLIMASADVIELYMAVFNALEAGDLPEARRIEAEIAPLLYFRQYVRGEFNNKMIMHRRGLFASPRKASPATSPGLEELTAVEEEELTELLRPLLPYYPKYPPRPPA